MKLFNKTIRLEKALPWILIICGTIGLICALIIMYEKVAIIQNPDYVPSCNLNPTVSCGSVMKSDQANAFGFPNPFLGMVGFPIVITTGVVLLAGAQKLKRWYWLGLQAGTIFGVLFIHWLFFQSVYRINALCPYCIVVWAMTMTLFWYVTLHNIQTGVITLSGRLRQAAYFMRRHHLDIAGVWILIIAGLILHHFWYYYGQFFHL
jgi:uncharacterized membrane protein